MATKSVTRRRKAQGPTKAELAEKVKELEAQVLARDTVSTNGETQEIPEKETEPVQEIAVSTDSEQAPEVNTEAAASEPSSADAPEKKPLPKALQERVDATAAIYESLQKEIEAFKSGQAYLEGDIPIALHGLEGPGFQHGQRSLNWINPDHLDKTKHFRWANKKMVDYHRGSGYRPTDYDEFTRMLMAHGSGHNFDRTPEGHVQSGDLVLVETSQDRYQVLQKQTASRTARKESRAKGNLYQKGEDLGVEVYEGQDAVGPKMGRLLEFLEKELGPGVTEAFLGGR